MKKILFLVLFTFFVLQNFAQCSVKIGNDVSLCAGVAENLDTIQLNPTISGTIGKVNATWSFSFDHGFNIYTHASYILDDTTKLNTKIVSGAGLPNNQWMPLILSIRDSLGNSCSDTIQIRFSKFAICLADCIYMIDKGESADLFTCVGNGIQPYNYNWSPNYNISNANTDGAKVYPDTSISYHCKITDSLGCKASASCNIIVSKNYSSIEEKGNFPNAKIYPNPILVNSVFEFDNEPNKTYQINIFDAIGKLSFQTTIDKGKFYFKNTNLNSGFYFLSLNSEGLNYSRLKFQIP